MKMNIPNDVVHYKWLADVLVICLKFSSDYPKMVFYQECTANRVMPDVPSVLSARLKAENKNTKINIYI